MEVEWEALLDELLEPNTSTIEELGNDMDGAVEEDGEEEDTNGGGWSFWANGLKRYGGFEGSKCPDLREEEAELKRSRRLLGKGEDVKGGAGIPVNSWTMALKLVVSVVNTVVGARLDALDLFFGFRTPLLLLPWSLGAEPETETEPREAFSGAGEICIVGKLPGALLCPPNWLVKKGWLWVDDGGVIKPPRSVWFGSDLSVLDQTISRFRREFGFVSGTDREGS